MTKLHGRRLYAALLISGAGTLVTMGLALSLLMIGSVIGPFRLFARDTTIATHGLGLWILPSSESAAPLTRERRLAAWRDVASDTAEILVVRSLSDLAERGVRVVAVPNALALSDSESRQLEGFLASGGGVILTGAFGVLDGQGRPRGTGAMQRLLRVPRVTLSPRGAAPALTSHRRGPLAAALAPGQQLALAPDPLLPGIDDPSADLVWLRDPESGTGDSASRRLDVGAGRLVWLAAEPAEIANAALDAEARDGRRLLAAAYAWAAREPFAEVLAAKPARGQEQLDPAAWLRLRERVAVRVERIGPHRSLVEVTNRDGAAWADLLLRVHLNTPTQDVEVGRTTLQQAKPELSFDWARNRVDVRLPQLAARASRAYTFDIAPLPAGALEEDPKRKEAS